jgi:hypothetical protein
LLRKRMLFTGYFHIDRVDSQFSLGRLDQRDVRDAGSQHTELQFRRCRSEVVASKISGTVADHLKIANADLPYTAASQRPHAGFQRVSLDIRIVAGRLTFGKPGRAFLYEVLVERRHRSGARLLIVD